MSKHNKFDDDDYVAKLLAEDAKKSSQRYAAVGLSALLPQRPTKGAPKPNTRFLSHIVREADNHNAALKKKEELEARIRLREMKEKETLDRRKEDQGRDRKRRKLDSDSERHSRHNERSRERRHSRSPHGERHHRRRKSREDAQRRKRDEREHGRSHKERSRTVREHHHGRIRNSDHGHSRSHSRSRSRSRSQSPQATKRRRSKRSQSLASESDPLEDLVGPLPRGDSKSTYASAPTRSRGRGVQTSSSSRSNIDAHFSSAYDPALDVHPEDESAAERGDWDMALEALRDRNMWKRKQSERMREAGFGDEDIKKWELNSLTGGKGSTGGEDVRNVKWAKKGEKREWDAGKKGFDD